MCVATWVARRCRDVFVRLTVWENSKQYTGWAKKVRPQTHGHNSFKHFNRFTLFFHWKIPRKICSKVAIKIPTIPCTLCCHTTLWNIIVSKQAQRCQMTIRGVQGSVTAYSRCGGIANNQIRNGLLPSQSVKRFFQSVNIWQSYKQERGCHVHFLCL